MQRLEVSCAVRLIYTSLGAKGFILYREIFAVYSESHNNTQFGHYVEFVCVKTWWYTTNKQYIESPYECMGCIHPFYDCVQSRACPREMKIAGALDCDECVNLRNNQQRHMMELLVSRSPQKVDLTTGGFNASFLMTYCKTFRPYKVNAST